MISFSNFYGFCVVAVACFVYYRDSAVTGISNIYFAMIPIDTYSTRRASNFYGSYCVVAIAIFVYYRDSIVTGISDIYFAMNSVDTYSTTHASNFTGSCHFLSV